VPKVVGRGKGGEKQLSEQSQDLEGVEMVPVQFDKGGCMRSPLTRNSPISEFGLGDREQDA